MKYTIVITYAFSPAWLKKTWQERADYEATHVRPILVEYAGRVSVRLFDAEAFSTEHSDFMIAEVADMKDYYFFIEALRESRLFKDELVSFKQILMGIEDGFEAYEREELTKKP
jgi:hypothetical protein